MSRLPVDGVELYWEAAGDGDPVLLLHGGFGSVESMRPQFEALARTRLVHAFERPGHGRTADIAEEFGYERGLADTVAYLDAQGLGPVHVIGFSDGAILALLLAMRHPDRVRSVVAISANLDPSAFRSEVESGPLILSPTAATPNGEADAAGDPDDDRAIFERLSPDGPQHADVVLEKLLRLWTTEPQLAPADLAAITAPALIVAGDRDSIRPDHSLLIAASIRGARLCIVPGASHDLLRTHPKFVELVIDDFLDSVERASAAAAC